MAEWTPEQIEKANRIGVGRRRGMSPLARDKMNERLEAETNWRGKCRRCGVVLRGTLNDIRAHNCRGANGDQGS